MELDELAQRDETSGDWRTRPGGRPEDWKDSEEAIDVGARKPHKLRCSTGGAQCAKFLTGRAELTDIESAVQPPDRE